MAGSVIGGRNQIWLSLFADLEDMLICAPSDLGATQLDQLHLVTTRDERGTAEPDVAHGEGGTNGRPWNAPFSPIVIRHHGGQRLRAGR